jgi:hypothetical protein
LYFVKRMRENAVLVIHIQAQFDTNNE